MLYRSKLTAMRRLLLLSFAIAINIVLFSQKSGSIKGRIIDKLTNEGLAGATVAIKATHVSITTNADGVFILHNLDPGNILLRISFVGYETLELPVSVTSGNTAVADAALMIDSRVGSEVVISASKRYEKIVNAPASIQVIGKKELEQFTGSNTFELLSKVQGVETTRIGVDGINLNARGLNNAFNN